MVNRGMSRWSGFAAVILCGAFSGVTLAQPECPGVPAPVCTNPVVVPGGCNDGPFPSVQCSQNNPCTFDFCDQSTGLCECSYFDNQQVEFCGNSWCDNEWCNGEQRCLGGSICTVTDLCCQGLIDGGFFRAVPDCDDANPCTQDFCDEVNDTCVNNPITFNPDDGQFCNGLETCVNGVLVAGTPLTCDDGFQCTDDSCDEVGDICNHVNNTSLCDDGDNCTDDDVCSLGLCAGTPPMNFPLVGNVSFEWRQFDVSILNPVSQISVVVGGTVNLDLYAVSTSGTFEGVFAYQAPITWDPSMLSIDGFARPTPQGGLPNCSADFMCYDWALLTFFPDELGDRFNEDMADDAFWNEVICTSDLECAPGWSCMDPEFCLGDASCAPGETCILPSKECDQRHCDSNGAACGSAVDCPGSTCLPAVQCINDLQCEAGETCIQPFGDCNARHCEFTGELFNDGDLVLVALGQTSPNPPAFVSPLGMYLARFQFTALTEGVSQIDMPLCMGNQTRAQLSGITPIGIQVLNDLPGTFTVAAVSCDPPTVTATGSRQLLVQLAAGSTPVAIRVTGDAGNPDIACVDLYVQADGSLDTIVFAQTPAEWGTDVYIYGAEIRPSSSYAIQIDCNPSEPGAILGALTNVSTGLWGDVDADGNAGLNDLLVMLEVLNGAPPPGDPHDFVMGGCIASGDGASLTELLLMLDVLGGGVFGVDGAGTAWCAPPCP